MIITKMHVPRRTILRGIGVGLALPLLDSMIPALAPRRALAAALPAKRFHATYVGMGFDMKSWLQDKSGELQIGPILQPMTSFRDRLLVVAGLDDKEAISNDQGQHPRAQAAWLTGCRAKKTDGPDIHLGTSLDQIIAAESAKETQLGSLELTVEPTDLAGSCAYGFSCAYNNTIAWRTPTTPLPMENNPRNVFERLFGASDSTDPKVRGRQLRMEKSVLDSVTEQVASFQKGLGPRDKQKVAEYLDAVRDAERRIQKAEEQSTREMPVVEQPAGMPANFDEYCRLMLDLQLLAWQTDMTRVGTFVLARESSNRSFPQIGVPDSHHPLSHHQNNPEKLARLAKVNAYHLKQLAYLVEKLQSTKEGDGTMLDNTLLLYGSGMSDGNLHIPTDLPTLVVSGKNFNVKGNRYLQAPPGRTPMANLQLTILEKFGLRMEKFGDSTGELNLLAV
jgi:hypothetical protein